MRSEIGRDVEQGSFADLTEAKGGAIAGTGVEALEAESEDLSFDALIGVQGKDQFLGDDNALFTFVLRVKRAAGFESRCDRIRTEVGSFEGNAFRAVSTAARKGEFDSAAGEQLV